MEKEFIYDAFISYRHTKLDKAVADKLQKKLERYVPPSSVTGGKTANKLRIYRDKTELLTSSYLTEDIKATLEKSRFLIVLCSKTTAQSKYCMLEITYFKELHGGRTDNIITILTEGDPSEVFPPELRITTRIITDMDGSERTETIDDVDPLAADVSAPTQKEALKKLNQEFLGIVARLFGYNFDTLYNRNQKRVIRHVVSVSAAVILFLTALTIYSSIMIIQISTQRDELAQRNTDLLIQESQYLSRESARLLDADDRIGAISAALAAIPTEGRERPWIPQAEFALSRALYVYQSGGIRIDRRLEHYSPVEQVVLSSDGTRLISRDTQNNLYIWNPITGENIGFFSSSANFDSRGFALCGNNRLYVTTGLEFICIDANTAKILWEIERDASTSSPLFGNTVILSNDEETVALVSTSGVVFVNTVNGEMKFYHSLLGDEMFLRASLESNGYFSTDDKIFYISSSDPFSIIGGREPEIGTLFRINMETGEITAQEFDNGSRVLGIYADEYTEIVAVSGYGGDNRDVLLAFVRGTQELLWEYVLSTNAGFRTDAFIYSYNDLVLVASGSSVVVVAADDGEMIKASTLSANVLYCFVIPELPDRIIAVLRNGEIHLTRLREDMFSPIIPLFGHWPMARYRNDLYAVGLIFDSTHEGISISNSMIYAFVPRNPQRHAPPYVAIARYLGDDNYIGIDVGNLVSHMIVSEGGELLAYAVNMTDEILVYVADTKTGEVLYRWSTERSTERNSVFNLSQLTFDTHNNIVLCAEAWLKIIDWRSDTIVFKFDAYDTMVEDWRPHWESVMAGDYAFFTNRWEHFLVNSKTRSYQIITIDDENDRVRIMLNHSALNKNGGIAVFSTSFFSGDRLLLITPDSAKPQLLDDDFTGRESFRTDLYWSDDGFLLAAINNRNEVIIYDIRTLERVKVIPLIAPVGISFTPDNKHLLTLGANGVLYKHSLEYAQLTRQLNVYDGASAPITRSIMKMFDFISLDGRDNIILTANNFVNSYIIDVEEFAFRIAIPSLGAFNEQYRIFSQVDSQAVRIRHFYSTDELVEMALSVLNGHQDNLNDH